MCDFNVFHQPHNDKKPYLNFKYAYTPVTATLCCKIISTIIELTLFIAFFNIIGKVGRNLAPVVSLGEGLL